MLGAQKSSAAVGLSQVRDLATADLWGPSKGMAWG